ncbi:OLC1v1023854C1 [Oldenlandia corymbosa var. corymbosa]|uniref:OLC1v1023854C1 n=1 Tax=Oldenlandia corymbosa var. corymbosa TaxID=529605 RepID=A0AAV1C0W9_OLDCO|nr:OLC1v1023854C1 [Oldenlandia corymbosa var. corymbosa]
MPSDPTSFNLPEPSPSEIPLFSGENIRDCLDQIERSFYYNRVPLHMRLFTASFYLSGEALRFLYGLIYVSKLTTCEDFADQLKLLFGRVIRPTVMINIWEASPMNCSVTKFEEFDGDTVESETTSLEEDTRELMVDWPTDNYVGNLDGNGNLSVSQNDSYENTEIVSQGNHLCGTVSIGLNGNHAEILQIEVENGDLLHASYLNISSIDISEIIGDDDDSYGNLNVSIDKSLLSLFVEISFRNSTVFPESLNNSYDGLSWHNNTLLGPNSFHVDPGRMGNYFNDDDFSYVIGIDYSSRNPRCNEKTLELWLKMVSCFKKGTMLVENAMTCQIMDNGNMELVSKVAYCGKSTYGGFGHSLFHLEPEGNACLVDADYVKREQRSDCIMVGDNWLSNGLRSSLTLAGEEIRVVRSYVNEAVKLLDEVGILWLLERYGGLNLGVLILGNGVNHQDQCLLEVNVYVLPVGAVFIFHEVLFYCRLFGNSFCVLRNYGSILSTVMLCVEFTSVENNVVNGSSDCLVFVFIGNSECVKSGNGSVLSPVADDQKKCVFDTMGRCDTRGQMSQICGKIHDIVWDPGIRVKEVEYDGISYKGANTCWSMLEYHILEYAGISYKGANKEQKSKFVMVSASKGNENSEILCGVKKSPKADVSEMEWRAKLLGAETLPGGILLIKKESWQLNGLVTLSGAEMSFIPYHFMNFVVEQVSKQNTGGTHLLKIGRCWTKAAQTIYLEAETAGSSSKEGSNAGLYPSWIKKATTFRGGTSLFDMNLEAKVADLPRRGSYEFLRT